MHLSHDYILLTKSLEEAVTVNYFLYPKKTRTL
jgi:hypothetical protein